MGLALFALSALAQPFHAVVHWFQSQDGAPARSAARPACNASVCREVFPPGPATGVDAQSTQPSPWSATARGPAVSATTILAATGCSVARDQQSVGSYVDDSAITASVKAKLAEDKSVSATAISVETLKGVVQLSGFAKSESEKARAAEIARTTKNVSEVRNSIVVKP